METQDGGDAKVEVSPRDIVYTQTAEASDGEAPDVLHKLDLRYGYSCNLIYFNLYGVICFSILTDKTADQTYVVCCYCAWLYIVRFQALLKAFCVLSEV